MRRRRTPADELRYVEAKLHEAEAHLAERQAHVDAAEAAERELAEVAADEFMGTVEPGAYGRERADRERRVVEARQERDRLAAAVSTLHDRAADLAEQIARDAEAAAERRLARASTAVAEAEAVLRERQRDRDEAEDALDDARDLVRVARVPFDPNAAAFASRLASQQREQVDWFAKNPHADPQVPRALGQKVAERREQLRREDNAARERLHAQAVASWVAAGMTRDDAEHTASGAHNQPAPWPS